MTKNQKIDLLMEAAQQHFPGIGDLKRTPTGAKARAAIAEVARNVAKTTGDREFLAIARRFESGMSMKPGIAAFDTK